MKLKNIWKVLTGLLAGLMLTLPLPMAALGAGEPGPAFDAVDIFTQEANVLTPRSAGTIVADNTAVAAGLPASTVVLFLIGGNVTGLDAANGEWQIGAPPVYVYEATDNKTVINGSPAAGSPVRVVGKRALAGGPIVAQYISLVDAAPAGPAIISTALLFNGTVTDNSAAAWTVAPPVGDPVAFSILMDAGPAGTGPTSIELGIGLGSAVTVEFLSRAAPQVNTENATNITATSATLNGHLLNLGTALSANVSFEWGATPGGPYPNETPDQQKDHIDSFAANITGLNGNATYYFRAKADAGVHGVAYGNEKSFTTAMAAPAVSTADNPSVTSTEATLGGDLTSLGSAASVAVSFQWGTASGNLPNSTQSQDKSVTGLFYGSLSGLSPGTTYFFRAKADGGANGTGYGQEKSFTTASAPVVPPPTSGTGGGESAGGSGTSGTSGTSGSGSGTSGTSGTSGSGSGTSGGPGPSGGAATTTTVSLSGMTGDKPLKVDNSGKTQDKVTLSSSGPGDKYALEIPAGTVMKGPSGAPVVALTFTEPASTPPAPADIDIVLAEDIGPNGATFDPPITLTMTFNAADLPAGVDEKDLVIAFWDGAKWVPLDTAVDAATNMLSAKVSHFTIFAILTGAPKPAPTPGPVTEPTTPGTPAPTPTPAPSTPGAPTAPVEAPQRSNTSVILAVVGAAVVIAGAAFYAIQRRRSSA